MKETIKTNTISNKFYSTSTCSSISKKKNKKNINSSNRSYSNRSSSNNNNNNHSPLSMTCSSELYRLSSFNGLHLRAEKNPRPILVRGFPLRLRYSKQGRHGGESDEESKGSTFKSLFSNRRNLEEGECQSYHFLYKCFFLAHTSALTAT